MNATPNATPRLLVVDDEPVVLESCRRIFATQGYEVEVSNDSAEGLKLASGSDYSAILVDFKMPKMDGLEFLNELRKTKPDVPVVMITGYASVPSAAAAMRMGASDYIPKPFTPEELISAVRRLALESRVSDTRVPVAEMKKTAAPARTIAAAAPQTAPAAQPAKAHVPEAVEDYYFLDEAWMKLAGDGTAEVGAFLPRETARSIRSIRFPRVGETVYRGLPLAVFSLAGKTQHVIPSPLTGEVVAINHSMAERPNSGWENPCKQGWVARVRPAALDHDLAAIKPRTLVLANSQVRRAAAQCKEMTNLGCKVIAAETIESVLEALRSSGARALVLDAASFGDAGPELVKQVNAAHANVQVVVVGDPGAQRESLYRAEKILYYAVEPFVDKEIIDILDAAFRPAIRALPPAQTSDALPETISRVLVTNHHKQDISMLVSGRNLMRHSGLGRQLIRALHQKAYPVSIDLGLRQNTLMEAMREIGECDRLMILAVEDSGRIPGSLFVDSKSDLAKMMASAGKKVVTLVVQPNAGEGQLLAFDERTTQALASHIVSEIARS